MPSVCSALFVCHIHSCCDLCHVNKLTSSSTFTISLCTSLSATEARELPGANTTMTFGASEDPELDAVRVKKLTEGITAIEINRKHKKNAIDLATSKKLYETFLDFENDNSQKVCVFYGAGETFCSGFDLTELEKWDNPVTSADNEGPPGGSITRKQFLPVNGRNQGPLGPSRAQVKKPVICAISGHAVAGGMELSLVADIRVVEEDVTFGVFNRRFGVPLLDGGTVRLQAIVGLGRAMDILLTGRPVGAEEAYSIGLANRVVPKGKSVEVAIQLARLLASFPQECLNADRDSCYYAAYRARSMEDALEKEFEGGTGIADLAIEKALQFTQRNKGRQSKL